MRRHQFELFAVFNAMAEQMSVGVRFALSLDSCGAIDPAAVFAKCAIRIMRECAVQSLLTLPGVRHSCYSSDVIPTGQHGIDVAVIVEFQKSNHDRMNNSPPLQSSGWKITGAVENSAQFSRVGWVYSPTDFPIDTDGG